MYLSGYGCVQCTYENPVDNEIKYPGLYGQRKCFSCQQGSNTLRIANVTVEEIDDIICEGVCLGDDICNIARSRFASSWGVNLAYNVIKATICPDAFINLASRGYIDPILVEALNNVRETHKLARC